MAQFIRNEFVWVVGLFLLSAYAFVQNDDFHKMFDNPYKREYNCDYILQFGSSGWHPDIPHEVINQCIKMKREKNVTST